MVTSVMAEKRQSKKPHPEPKLTADPRDFYFRRVPAQWNRALDEQTRSGGDDPEAARVAAAMQAVSATIRVRVEGGGEADDVHLNVLEGRMAAEKSAVHPPFMTLIHDLAAFEVLEQESGDSVLGFLGGLAGLDKPLKAQYSNV